MSVSIPQPFKTKLVSPIGVDPITLEPMTVNPVTVNGIPDTFHIQVEELPTIVLSVDKLPPIHLSIDNLPKIQLGFDPVEIKLTELPSIRGHLPADFCVGLSVMGMELMNLRLCGEAQIITEPYRPNPCEVCSPVKTPPDTNPNLPGGIGRRQ
jgi:hypothetical protein